MPAASAMPMTDPELRLLCLPGMEAQLPSSLASLTAWPRRRIWIYAPSPAALPPEWQDRFLPLTADQQPWAQVLSEPWQGWCLLMLADEVLVGWSPAAWDAFLASHPLATQALLRHELRGWQDLQPRLLSVPAAIDPEGASAGQAICAGPSLCAPARRDADLMRVLARLEARGSDAELPLRGRLLQALGRGREARDLLTARLAGAVQSVRAKGLRILRRDSADSVKLQAARLLLALEDPAQAPQQLLQRLQGLSAQLPELEQSPESWALKAEIAWNMGQESVAAACASQALSQPHETWRWLPLTQGLPSLRLAQSALLQGRDAETLLAQAENALAGQASLALSYARFVAGGSTALAHDLRQQQERFGVAAPLLRQLSAVLRGERPDSEALSDLLLRPGGSFERLVLYELLKRCDLEAATLIDLLQTALARAPQPEWALALGRLHLSQGQTASALAAWSALPGHRLPGRLLGELASHLAAVGEQALARRCLERCLLEAPDHAPWQQALVHVLQTEAPWRTVIQLPQAPDWANGGDLALKLCLGSLGGEPGLLIQVPCGWDQPLLAQALNWAHQHIDPAAMPAICCGELPVTAARSIRLAPWRRPDGSGHEAEIQPQPQQPADGPIYVYCHDPSQQALWVEPDPASLLRWLRAALIQNLPPRPAATALVAPPNRLPLALMLGRHALGAYSERPGLSQLAANFAEIRQPGPSQSWRELAPEAEWLLWLDPDEDLDQAYLAWLSELAHRLPLASDAVALGGWLPDGSGPWPVPRLIRRRALHAFSPALAAAMADTTGDARLLWQPDLPLRLAPGANLTAPSPLARAWIALQARDLARAEAELELAQRESPASARQQAGLARLALEILAVTGRWQELLAASQKPELPPLTRAWYQGLALRRLNQPARAALQEALRLCDTLPEAPIDLLPPIPRSAILSELAAADLSR